MAEQFYTLGRGEVSFAAFLPNTKTPRGYRYTGNTPAFSFTSESSKLDHISADHGRRRIDASASLGVTRSGTLSTDNIEFDNLAMHLFGTKAAITTTASTITGYQIPAAQQGLQYLLGQTAANPSGVRGLVEHTTPGIYGVVKDTESSPTTFVYGTDYVIDPETGLLTVIEGGGIDDNTDLVVDFKTGAMTHHRVASGDTPFEGSVLFIADNPEGPNIDYVIPWVKLTPTGEYALKTGEDWQVMNFAMEILEVPGRSAIYANGRPFPTLP